MTRRALIAAAAFLALPVPAASASTVHVAEAPTSRTVPATTAAWYEAAPGERNRLVVTFPRNEGERDMQLHDAGAVIRAGRGCTSLDSHTVRCRLDFFGHQVRAQLRDGDDELRATNGLYAVFHSIVANGGPGDDVLVGDYEDDEFDGGGGRDELRGGNNIDFLTDGDRSGASGESRPGPDLLDGGSGHDQVSYESRTRRVRVNLATEAAVAGERGENDTVRNVEDADGGSGPDRLSGNGDDSDLRGHGGNDVLVADAARHDTPFYYGSTLDGGAGRDRLKGGDRADRLIPGSGRDRLSCALGYDTVEGAAPREVIGRCENLFYEMRFGDSRALLELPPHPTEILARAVEFHLPCADPILSPGERCARRITIRKAFGRRVLLGRARVGGSPRTVVRLTRAGRRLVNRRGGVAATMTLTGPRFRRVGWTTRLGP